MKKILIMLMVLVLTFTATVSLAESTLKVHGKGDSYITAEIAYVDLGVQAREANVRDAQQKVNSGIEKVVAALIESGIAKEDINTDNINIYMYTDYSSLGKERVLYNASSMITVRVSDPNGAGSVIDIAFSAGANILNGITFAAENTEEAEKEALTLAVEEARKKAEILAAAAGMRLGDMISMEEQNVYSYDSGMNNFSMKDVAEEAAGTVVRAAKLCVSAQVYVEWQMVKAE